MFMCKVRPCGAENVLTGKAFSQLRREKVGWDKPVFVKLPHERQMPQCRQAQVLRAGSYTADGVDLLWVQLGRFGSPCWW